MVHGHHKHSPSNPCVTHYSTILPPTDGPPVCRLPQPANFSIIYFEWRFKNTSALGSWAPVCRGASLRAWRGEMGSRCCNVGPVVVAGTLRWYFIELWFKGDGSRGGIGHDGLRRGRDRRWKSWSMDGAPAGAPGFRADRGVGTGLV